MLSEDSVNTRLAPPEARHTGAILKSEPSIRPGFRHPNGGLTLLVPLVSVLICALLVPAWRCRSRRWRSYTPKDLSTAFLF